MIDNNWKTTEPRILFLDLDGTVRYSNKESGFINKAEDVEVYPEAREQIERFRKAGWMIAFISNQGGVSAGYTTVADVAAANERTFLLLGLRASHARVYYCTDDPNGRSLWRKPRPGMVFEAIDSLIARNSAGVMFSRGQFDPGRCLFVGDRDEDRGCAAACGIPFMSAETWRAGVSVVEPMAAGWRDAYLQAKKSLDRLYEREVLCPSCGELVMVSQLSECESGCICCAECEIFGEGFTLCPACAKECAEDAGDDQL